MLDIDDRLLMRCTAAPANETLDFKFRLGSAGERLVLFLPWRISLAVAERAALIPDNFFACYELPNALVSSSPALAASAMRRVVDHAMRLLGAGGAAHSRFVVAGLSLGSAPATFIANKLGCRLISVASADRGDRMLWESPAISAVKARAIERGYDLADYSVALEGMHTVQNLCNVQPDSIFVVADQDLYVPRARRSGLIEAVRRIQPEASVVNCPAGHARTISWAMRTIADGNVRGRAFPAVAN